MYVPDVSLSIENDKKLLQQLKSGFKRTVKCNKYRSKMNIQSNNNNLNYLIDPTFTKVSRLFNWSTDYLFCHLQELLEKMIQEKIIDILFNIIMYQILKKKKDKTMEQQCNSSFKNQKKLLLNFYKILWTSYKSGNAKGCKFVEKFWE